MKKVNNTAEKLEVLYTPSSQTERYEDIAQLSEFLTRHGLPTERFNEFIYRDFLNYILVTAKRWDEHLIKQMLDKDHYDEGSID